MRKLLKRDEGFTLIELMVVVLIIGILVAIALPTFLGARNRANDKAAQSGVRNALAAAKTCFTDDDSYQNCNGAALGDIETALEFEPPQDESTDPSEISVVVFNETDPGTVILLAAYSKAGNCFGLEEDPQAGTGYWSSTTGNETTCDAARALGAPDASW